MKRLSILLTTAVAALAVVGNAAASVSTGVSFGVRPSHYDAGDPATRAYFKHVEAPGGSFADSVVVSNGGTSPVTLLAYPVDGLTGQTSGSVYANHGDRIRKAGRWVHVDVSRIVVAAGATRTVSFTVHVPRNATSGDHLAGIAFEDANPTTSGGSFRIKQVLREVLGVLVRVPGPTAARLSLGKLSLQTLPGTGLASVLVGIGNTGTSLCKPHLRVALADGGVRSAVSRQLDTILPGDTISYPLVLAHGLKSGTYRIDAHAACARTTAHEATTFRLGEALKGAKDVPVPAAAPAPTRTRFPLWMLTAVAGLAIVVTILLGLVVYLRRALR
jgi:hypothetical protein